LRTLQTVDIMPPLLALLAAAVAEAEPPGANDQLSGAEIGAAMRTTSDIELCNGREACTQAHDAAVAHIQQLGNGYEPQNGRETRPLPEVVGSSWWSSGAAPESFEVSKLNSIYNASGYYRGYGVYVTPHYVPLMMRFCGQVLGRRVQSVLELGNGGGAFTVVYRRLGVDIVTVEGTALGYASTLKRGIPLERVVQHDLRLPLRLRRRFDAVILTEVVEHVEPVFSSTIVLNAVLHSDVIWFSYKHSSSRARAYLNHPNEQPRYRRPHPNPDPSIDQRSSPLPRQEAVGLPLQLLRVRVRPPARAGPKAVALAGRLHRVQCEQPKAAAPRAGRLQQF